jgi:hypothetical protein
MRYWGHGIEVHTVHGRFRKQLQYFPSSIGALANVGDNVCEFGLFEEYERVLNIQRDEPSDPLHAQNECRVDSGAKE